MDREDLKHLVLRAIMVIAAIFIAGAVTLRLSGGTLKAAEEDETAEAAAAVSPTVEHRVEYLEIELP